MAKGENNPNFGKFGKDAFGYKEINKEIIDAIIFDYTQMFISIKKLSVKYNLTNYKITELLKENNIILQPVYMSNENKEKILNMYINKKLSISKISKKFNIDSRNIKKVLIENNIEILKTGGKSGLLQNIQEYINNNSVVQIEQICRKFDISRYSVLKYIELNIIKLHK